MPRVTKGNPCQHLQDALELFVKVTGKAVGASFTWSGQVRVFGNDNYKDFAAEHKQEIWHSLISSVHPPGKCLSLSQPDRDRNFLSILSEGNFPGLNVYTLRRLVVWITQKSIGESDTFIMIIVR